jgi:hypothetical protein
MNRIRPRSVGALALAGALGLAATPAATAAPERRPNEPRPTSSFSDVVTTRVTLRLEAGPAVAETGRREVTGTAEGSHLLPDRGATGPSAENGPTASPQLGGEADPDG